MDRLTGEPSLHGNEYVYLCVHDYKRNQKDTLTCHCLGATHLYFHVIFEMGSLIGRKLAKQSRLAVQPPQCWDYKHTSTPNMVLIVCC